MDCHARCAACCTVISIASPIPGMPDGKPAGVACVQLDADLRCRIHGRPERPAVCRSLQRDDAWCGPDAATARARWGALEAATRPLLPVLPGRAPATDP
ncbi:MAG: YkgJ family cysteine cluster protein [Chloroflexota bacterium]